MKIATRTYFNDNGEICFGDDYIEHDYDSDTLSNIVDEFKLIFEFLKENGSIMSQYNIFRELSKRRALLDGNGPWH